MPEPRPPQPRTRPSNAEGGRAAPPQPGEVAHLTILATSPAGALLDGGGPEDLLLPWKEVRHELKHQIKVGKKVLVFLFWSDDDRITASTRLQDFLRDEAEGLQAGEQVNLVVAEPTDLGVRVIVNHRFWGMVHSSDIFCNLARGDRRVGYIKALRPDRKLNVALQAPGYGKVDDLAQGLLDTLKRRGGFLPVTDKSSPEEIYALFGISKKAFKLTLGALYKSRRILIGTDGIRLAPKA